jgi:Flp pilus assembly protein TadG
MMTGISMVKRSIASLCGDTEGSVLVEAALILPIFILLTIGSLEFSWYFQKQQLVESGVRDAARYMARVNAGAEDANPCSDATATSNAKGIAVNGVTSGGTARVSGWTVSNVTVTCPSYSNSGTYNGAATIYRVTVTTTFPDPAIGFFGSIGLAAPNLSATHTERSIGPG